MLVGFCDGAPEYPASGGEDLGYYPMCLRRRNVSLSNFAAGPRKLDGWNQRTIIFEAGGEEEDVREDEKEKKLS